MFVVEKDTDEAKREAERLIALEVLRRDDDEEEEEKKRVVGRARRRRSARVVVSGSAEGCSQKIAQQLRGVEELAAEDERKNDERGVGSASAEKYRRRRSRRSRTNTKSPERNGRVMKYVLFLDDDVMLYPSTIGSLVRAMEKDEKETGGNALLATGYPLDFVGGGVDGGEILVVVFRELHDDGVSPRVVDTVFARQIHQERLGGMHALSIGRFPGKCV